MIQDQIAQASGAAGVPTWLALAVAQRESGFNQNRVGAAGEIGVFQLMPSTAAGLGVDPNDLQQNIAGGVAYLAQMLNLFAGNVQLATAAYNCGPGCVQNALARYGDAWFQHIPASTQAYVLAVTGSAAALDAQNAAPDGGQTPDGAALTYSAGMVPDTFTGWLWGGAAVLGFLLLRRIGSR